MPAGCRILPERVARPVPARPSRRRVARARGPRLDERRAREREAILLQRPTAAWTGRPGMGVDRRQHHDQEENTALAA